MVRQYGMSEALGPVAYDPERKTILPVNEFMPSCEHGGTVGDQIDVEVRRVLERALKRARDTIEGQRDNVEQVVALLLEKEQIEGDELRQVLGLQNAAAEA
jgi:cell division protease FtsH